MMQTGSENFSRDDLTRIETETFVRTLEFYRELPSTNDLALELASHVDLELPLLVLAESQTAGRGRGDNRWWAMPGALTFSLVIDTAASLLPIDRWPQASLTVGLSVCEALEHVRPELKCRIKWPNDVYVGWRKLSGILVEVPQASSDRLVIGVGVNVNNSLAAAPQELQDTATTVYDETHQHVDLGHFLVDVLHCCSRRLQDLVAGNGAVSRAWQQRCVLRGRSVKMESGSREVTGLCDGIDIDGTLLLQTNAGLQRFYSGTVTRID